MGHPIVVGYAAMATFLTDLSGYGIQFAHELFISIFFECWAENLMLAQISVIDCNSAPKIVSCSEKLEFIGQSNAFCG